MSKSWLLFACWAVAGGALVLGFLTMFTIGVALLPISLAAVVALLFRKESRNETALGLLVGGALPLIYVAWLNRAGPGTVCNSTALGDSCVDEWSPWPWLVAGLFVAATGIVAFAVVKRRRGASRIPHPGPRLGH